MGLNQSQSKGVFLSITNGKLVRQFSSPTEKSVSRVNKMGREVHEEFYDSLTGYLTDIKTKESEYGKSWVLVLKDNDGSYNLEMKYSSGYATSFLKAIPNAELSQLITLSPKLIVDGDKKQSVLFISQNGKGLKHFWTKDTPRDLPPMVKVKVRGVDTWDDTDRMEYLDNYVKDIILPKIKPSLQDFTEGDDAPF
jgi:hypothetical protein